MTETDNYFDKLNNIICVIKFIIILDNNGKLIYSRYYNCNDLNTKELQAKFEKKICSTCININIIRNETDIFSLNDYIIVCKISNELAIFFGANENSNEVLLEEFYNTFEDVLCNQINDSLSKTKILEVYENLIIGIDEMINNGIVMNCKVDNINDIILLKKMNTPKPAQSRSFFSFSSTSINELPTNNEVQKKTGSSLFGSLLFGAKDYLSKNLNY